MSAVNELEIYKRAENSDAMVDVLGCCKAHVGEFLHLLKLAKNYLAIPVTSKSSENAFLAGRTFLTDYRRWLLPNTTEACMCLMNWLKDESW